MAKQKEQQKDSEITEKVLYINRCAKVVKGGRKFSFSALILCSDGKGKVGYGFAKANELTDAIQKGSERAKKTMRRFPMEGTTIPHEIKVHYDGVILLLKPVPRGAGMIAGSKARDVLEMAGYRDVMAKSLGATNPINMVKATFKALESLENRQTIREERGL